jgi:hypothetical protein
MTESKRIAAIKHYETFRSRPGMFTVETYDCVAAFISGIDLACDHELLVGFQEWVTVKMGKSPQAWVHQIKEHFDAMTDSEKGTFGESRTRFLFSRIDQFLKEREQSEASAAKV